MFTSTTLGSPYFIFFILILSFYLYVICVIVILYCNLRIVDTFLYHDDCALVVSLWIRLAGSLSLCCMLIILLCTMMYPVMLVKMDVMKSPFAYPKPNTQHILYICIRKLILECYETTVIVIVCGKKG